MRGIDDKPDALLVPQAAIGSNQIGKYFSSGTDIVDESSALPGRHESAIGVRMSATESRIVHHAILSRDHRLLREWFDLRYPG